MFTAKATIFRTTWNNSINNPTLKLIDGKSIEEIGAAKGAIEEALPLSELREGESAIVLYPLGGSG
jgi:hypothetical protein